MVHESEKYQVVIVGGGPVGLFLAICLQKMGISTLILEKREKPRSGSRSLGIHPVSLELFEKIRIADIFTEEGIKISEGHAFANTKKLGTLSFDQCPQPFNFILALPQSRTERLLEEQLNTLDSSILQRGAKVQQINQSKQFVKISYHHNGQPQSVKTSYLIGCDGKHSLVRQQADMAFEGAQYPDTYIMGDFTDNTDFGSDAAIFLCDDGLIESFPLLDNQRRWVVKTDNYLESPTRDDVEQRVHDRTGHQLMATENTMLSSFGVQKFVAHPMVQNRIIVAGDAAHIISPIGGQGMNLGWLDAWDLAQSLQTLFTSNQNTEHILQQFEKRRQKAARNAIRRAELNMRLGRKANFPAIRNGIVSLMLNTPLSNLMANIFTMRGIERWIV